MTNDEVLAALAASRNRNEAAQVYANALDMLGKSSIRWLELTDYLIARWSVSGARYIRRRGWAIHDAKIIAQSASR